MWFYMYIIYLLLSRIVIKNIDFTREYKFTSSFVQTIRYRWWLLWVFTIYFSDLFHLAKKECVHFGRNFDEISITKGIWYKTRHPRLTNYLWIHAAYMSRNNIITSFRPRSSHIPLNSSSYLIGKTWSPNSSICNKKEDVSYTTSPWKVSGASLRGYSWALNSTCQY